MYSTHLILLIIFIIYMPSMYLFQTNRNRSLIDYFFSLLIHLHSDQNLSPI